MPQRRRKKVEGSLLLDTREGSRKGGDQGPAVVPGDPDKSLLIQAIRYTDEDLQMPPKAEGQLPAGSRRRFRGLGQARRARSARPARPAATATTIDIEAAKQRWPFTPPVEPAVPAVKDTAWPRNPIDNFILAKLEEKGLAPAGDADKRTLLRRVTYDLTGLPPTAEEMDDFLLRRPLSLSRLSLVGREGTRGTGRQETKRWQAVVDRLLASPHYGERWGRHWLDVVRYADTAGDNSRLPDPADVQATATG